MIPLVHIPIRHAKLARLGVFVLTFMLVVTLFGASLAPLFGQASQPGALDKHIFIPIAHNQRPHCTYRGPQHIFGVQMYGSTRPNSRYFGSLIESGADWVRVPFEWANIEPENTSPDRYNWRTVDSYVGAATFACLEVILTFGTAPGWAAPFAKAAIPENRHDDAAELLAAVVERYDGDGKNDAPGSPKVNYIEIYNEPDERLGPASNSWGPNGALYGKLLAAVTPKMKQANRNVKVLLGGLAYDNFVSENPTGGFVETFLDDVIAGGGGPHFDIMNFHAYPAFARRWADQGPGLLEKTKALRDKLAGLGFPNKPFIVTETGWYSNSFGTNRSDHETQMRYVVELLTQAKAANLQSVIWFSLADPGTIQHETGLVTNDNPPKKKPSFSTYQMVVEVLGPARFDRILPVSATKPSDMEVYEFSDTARQLKIYVAWLNPITTNTTKPLVLPGEQATVRSVRNERTTVTDAADGNNDGSLQIAVSARPIIIEVPQ